MSQLDTLTVLYAEQKNYDDEAHAQRQREAERARRALNEWHPPGTPGPHTALRRPIPVLCRRCWALDDAEPYATTCVCRRGAERRPEGSAEPERRLLCQVCAGTLLRDFSRWSTILCATCRVRAVDVNSRLQRVVVPIGRHSLVNGSTIRPLPDAPDDRDVPLEQFAAGLAAQTNAMIRSLDQLEVWGRRRTREECQSRGLADGRDVPLAVYLWSVHDQPVDRYAAFQALLSGGGGRRR